MRLDKWLWHARIYKTRTLATDKVTRGKVRVNGSRTTKPSRSVVPGDVLTLVQGREIKVLKITGLPERRGPAPEARDHYDLIEDTE
jgi:ribosome-associated heat shock protein Hsp15